MKTNLLFPILLTLGLFTVLPSPARAGAPTAAPAAATASARPAARSRPPAARAIEGVANINTATPQELQLLPGIGPAKVRDIVAYRNAQPFRSVDDLLKVKGIGQKMLARLRPHLNVSGPTNLRLASAAPSGSNPVAAGGPTARPQQR